MHDKMRNGFRKLGNAILGIAYKNTIFDSNVKLASEEDTSDNFDIILETAEKFSILRPILPPAVSNHLTKKMEEHSLVMLADTFNCFYPDTRPRASPAATMKNHNSDLSNLPSWLTFLTDNKNDDDESALPPPIGDAGTDGRETSITAQSSM